MKLTGKKLRALVKEELSKIITEGRQDFRELNTSQRKKLVMHVIDQTIYRQREWGDKLIEGQFDQMDVAFTEENIREFFEWVNSRAGKALTKKVIKDLEYDKVSSFDSFEEMIDYIYDDVYGWFGKKAMQRELNRV